MKLRKILSIVLVLSLVLATFTVAAAVPNKNIQELKKQTFNKPTFERSISSDQRVKELKDTDEVRIIVELEDKPLIEYATEKGVKVKDLDKATTKKVKEKLNKAQGNVKNNIKSNKINIKYHKSFTTVANGFSGTTSFGEAKKIEKLQGVKNVYITNEYQSPEPDMTTSIDIVNAVQTWEELGYTGEGMVVAIIDTGIDPSHKDMVLTNNDNARLQQSDIENIINEKELPGTWRTVKVPYGYNYMDENQEILDLGPDASRHGMHVAGTVGANGDVANGGIKGVAPEVQLLAMKVFGNNPAMPSTFGDVIVKAIDDSVLLGADVINMSLGDTAQFVDDSDLEQVAIRNAVENGVLVSVSSGNSGDIGYGYGGPMDNNPDIGVVGAPGLAPETIQVASIHNTKMKTEAIEYGVDGLAGYTSAAQNPISAFDGPVEYAYCGLGGTEADFEGVELEGKIALIQRGGYDFVVKIMNAQNHGAIGVIVFNHDTGGEGLISMAYPEEGTIPAVFIQQSHGLNLLNLIETGENYVEFNGVATTVNNPDAGKMAGSSSWGTTPNLDIKPEITAPGANIWSTDQNNGYQLMSGTSMAAPHVSGGSSLILQRVDEIWQELSGNERVQMAKNLLMSTAKAHIDAEYFNNAYQTGMPTSPRRQGAGVMDLYAAANTPAIAYDPDTKLSKINLSEIGDITTFTVTVENFSDEDVTYSVNGTVGTTVNNTIASYGYYPLEADMIINAETYQMPISFNLENGTITVPANSTVSLNATIDLNNTIDWFYEAPLNLVFPNGNFVEGFISLVDVNDNAPELSIPYVGFYGEWDKAPIIDDSIYDENGNPFMGRTVMTWLDEQAETYRFLGIDAEGNIDENNIAFSPNGDGIADTTVPLLSFLRNAKELDIDILDSDGNKIRDLAYQENIKKNYGLYYKPLYKSYDFWTWDGTLNNEIAADGQYFYEIKTRIDFDNSDWQTLLFPVKIDTVAPVIENIEYDKEAEILTVTANDGDYPIHRYELIENGQIIAESIDGYFDLSEVTYTHKAFVRVHDFAWNVTDEKLEPVLKGKGAKGPKDKEETEQPTEPTVPVYEEPIEAADGDTTIPTVMVTSPEFFGTFDVGQLTIDGYIKDASSIETFKVNGIDVPYVFNTVTGNWDFTTTVTLEDGYHTINIEAEDSAGNAIAFGHKVFVDTKAPVIDMTEEPVEDTRESSITLNAIITDNLPSMKVRVNGNMITNISPDWSYFDTLPSAEYVLSYEVELKDGKNIIVIEAEDDAGNITVKEFNVNKIKEKKND